MMCTCIRIYIRTHTTFLVCFGSSHFNAPVQSLHRFPGCAVQRAATDGSRQTGRGGSEGHIATEEEYEKHDGRIENPRVRSRNFQFSLSLFEQIKTIQVRKQKTKTKNENEEVRRQEADSCIRNWRRFFLGFARWLFIRMKGMLRARLITADE